jgi:serpin B
MMKQIEEFGYGSGVGYHVVELPYSKRELSMVFIVPDLDRFEDFDCLMNKEIVDDIIGRLEQRQIDLRMPAALVMGADFSGMDGTRDLFIRDVVHQAFVSLDEEGTEAAAATMSAVAELGGPIEEPIKMKINRPFIFLIRDIEMGSILFLGRVLDPR